MDDSASTMAKAAVRPSSKRQKSRLDRDNELYLFMSAADERAYYDEVCERIIRNPRWYLNNLSELSEFRVRFENYKPRKKSFINKVTPSIRQV